MTIRLPLNLPGVDKDDADTWPEFRICDSQDHPAPMVAAVLMHWVTGPVEYCHGCAHRMRQVAAVMGTHVAEEPIDQPHLRPVLRRAVALDGRVE